MRSIAQGLSFTVLVTGFAAAANPCCDALTKALGGKVIHGSNILSFTSIKRSYWTSLESGISPDCFIQPESAQDVAAAVKILVQPQHREVAGCKFAVRSGGHTTWPGAANIQGGVTIDMSNMKEITISSDKSKVSLGPGNRWGDVYSKLGRANIAVSGGRWANVGVGGLLTGGGLSFFQGTEGMSCDGVLEHEVVLASGEIVHASSQENNDLHRALKGGSNNFGIVTKFTMKAFPQTEFWGGMIYGSNMANEAGSMRWFEGFANSSSSSWDPHSMTMFSLLSYVGVSGSGCLATHSKPSVMRMTDRVPASFASFYRYAAMTPVGKTTPYAVARANAGRQANGGRSIWATITHKNSASYMRALQSIADSKATPGLISVNLVSQPVWAKPRAASFRATGGNVLGLEDSNDDLVVALVMVSWATSAMDSMGRSAAKSIIDAATTKAKSMRVYNRYVYTNYAADFQDPMIGYGEKNLAFMRDVSRKYDPQGTFQKQVPGGFKLWRTSGSGLFSSRGRVYNSSQLHGGDFPDLVSGEPGQWEALRMNT